MTRYTDLVESFQEEHDVKLATHWEVCGGCNGRGTETLRDFAFTGDDFAEDPDFADAYFGGVYDEPCRDCKGRTTILAVDEEALPPEIRGAWFAYLRDDAETEAMYAMERRMGA
jgi:hypothetical protein